MKVNWNKEELTRLYWTENKSLQQIGDLFGVTRERVNQIMERYSIPRRNYTERQRSRPHKPRFKSLNDYLLNGKGYTRRIHKFLPENIICAECQSKEHIHIHHIRYPAKEVNDIQILCHSCHSIKHRKGITYIQQIDIYIAYISGIPVKQLSEQYHCSRSAIHKIIAKIKNGWTAQKH